MGSVCCVAARDRTIQSGPSSETHPRNIRCSPTWSFPWENRGRVAGEEASVGWLSDGLSRNDGSDIKYGSAYTSEEGSPLETLQRRTWKKSISEAGSPLENIRGHTWQKSPLSEEITGQLRTSVSDHSSSRTICTEGILGQVKESTDSVVASYPSPAELSVSLPSTSPISASPPSSKSHLHAGSSTLSRWPLHPPGYQLSRQASDSQVASFKSPNSVSISEGRPMHPLWINDSTRGSCGGSSDGWSMNAFSELMATSRRDSWSLDSESFGFSRDKITRCNSRSTSAESQTCGVCLKLLTERSVWSSQKIITYNEPPAVAILICGHVYHADCLEGITLEVDMYDPPCPICTYGAKQTVELSEKVLKAGLGIKAKNINKLKNRVSNGDFNGESLASDRLKGSMDEGKGPKMSNSSIKGSHGKPFLKRHFTFGSKGSKSLSENHPTRRKGFFWVKSSKQ